MNQEPSLPEYDLVDPRTEHDYPFTTEYDNGWTEVHHPAGDAAAGFDLTDMGSADAARDLLAVLGLPTEPVMVDDSPEDGDASVLYVWANDSALIVTGNDPLTGTYKQPAHRARERGYCSYVGIEGEPDAVDAAVRAVKTLPTGIKGFSDGTRDFI